MSISSPQLDSSCRFTPREINSPNKDQQGLSKTVFSHISKLQGLLNDWGKMKDKGTRLCKAIGVVKLHECEDTYYPSQLQPLMEGLLDIIESLQHVIDGVEVISSQLQALSKLPTADQPVISTWSVIRISNNVTNICESLKQEYKLKQTITENVAHCRDENLIEVYLSAWELESYYNVESNAYLFAEVGLTGIT